MIKPFRKKKNKKQKTKNKNKNKTNKSYMVFPRKETIKSKQKQKM